MSIDEAHFKLMRLLEASPGLSQRELAKEMGVSVGKLHYCLKALVENGFVKMRNFSESGRKLEYSYILTPSGLQEKTKATIYFLKRKMDEYESLKREIEVLRREVSFSE